MDETTTTTDYDNYSSSDFNTSSSSSSSSFITSNINDNDNDIMKKKWKIKSIFVLIMCICIIMSCLLIFINIFSFFYIKNQNKVINENNNNNNNNNEIKGRMYGMFLYDKNEKIVKMEVVKMKEDDEKEYEGDFYAFESDNWSGMVYNLGLEEGEVYKFCADECKCFVECKENDDCGEEMKCSEEYECVDVDENNMKRRKETSDLKERRFAQVAILIPMALCSFGVFTSMYLAEDYGRKYFDEKCKVSCPSTSSSNVDVETEKQNRERIFYCSGTCELDIMGFDKQFHQKLKEAGQESLIGYSVYSDFERESADFCFTQTIETEETAHDDIEAFNKFTIVAEVSCRMRNFNWILDGPLMGTGLSFLNVCTTFISVLFCYIFKDICRLNENSVSCR